MKRLIERRGIALLFIGIFVLCNAAFSAEYASTTLFKTNWGSGAGELGLVSEGPYFTGPENFVAVDNENIFILDTANGRVNKYDKNGVFIKSIIVSAEGSVYPTSY